MWNRINLEESVGELSWNEIVVFLYGLLRKSPQEFVKLARSVDKLGAVEVMMQLQCLCLLVILAEKSVDYKIKYLNTNTCKSSKHSKL